MISFARNYIEPVLLGQDLGFGYRKSENPKLHLDFLVRVEFEGPMNSSFSINLGGMSYQSLCIFVFYKFLYLKN